MADALDFSKKYEFLVDVLPPDGDPLTGAKLTFGGGDVVHLVFGDIRDSARFEAPEISRLSVPTGDGDLFTLCECAVRANSAFANFIVAGEITDGFDRMSVQYTEISEWFFLGQRIVGNVGDSLTWSNAPPP
ncbi:hypothetical protein [Ralstonia mannitolilytica]|uniref:Uncharacterized protein n=1 Tax=Ralstonia mannitolilytica TaxID=105219 RepID=A0AAJ4ZLB8_9RALS|nr:hypothetical protein [Ralstonia mannitolilytica]CAG2151824.1 hypothetical protein LMG6866_04131 [Ralstonia mannitolilytica]SUD87887.1 Uncharacterised protein [Ralstonia mannitolilytica]SUD93793.1 Uncharacterised protein [Ralstonia mannitolilytica]SUD97547.1 Uncharacterised protein [Ralstonia mannitolilytica]